MDHCPGNSAAQAGGGFVLSLDFELMWGVKGARTVEDYGGVILGTRRAIPRLLDLFSRYGIGCTWATVGFLLFDSRDALLAALPEDRPCYPDPAVGSYGYLDQLGPDEASDPLHFARSLVCRIAQAPRQEIATHTFSHYYCLEAPLDAPAFAADLAAARQAAAELGLATRSIVFPRNQVCTRALEICRDQGITAYRGAGPFWYDRPMPRASEGRLRRASRLAASYAPFGASGSVTAAPAHGMVNVPASRFLRPVPQRWPAAAAAQTRSIRRAMRQAARQGRLFHLWFHPHNFGARTDACLAMLEEILAEQNRLQQDCGWPSLTMAEAAAAVRDPAGNPAPAAAGPQAGTPA